MSTPPVRTDAFEKEKLNYYEVLEIPPDASQSDIRQAYFRAKAAYGKDSNAVYSLFDVSETKSMLERIEEAYLVLSNGDRRKEYDRTHGFLKGMGEIQAMRKPPAKHVYSFGGPKPEQQQGSSDLAQNAASAVFGSDAMGTEFGAEPSKELPAQRAIRSGVDAASEEGVMAPRTLDGSSSSTSIPSSPMDAYAPSNRESRVSPVRRMELVKPHESNAAMEESIKNEALFRGDFIRQVREYRSITVDELCEFTKISKTYINCIEAEEFDSLPAPAYVRGFVSQIAKAIKLPSDKVAAAYMKHYYSVVGGK